MANKNSLQAFKAWSHKVLPLVYDDSLSYYETLCKVVEYLNKVIESTVGVVDDWEELKKELELINQWIDNFDTQFLEKIISEHIATMVFFGLTESGYFVTYIPDNWDNLGFATTGMDIEVPLEPEYGHLVLLY